MEGALQNAHAIALSQFYGPKLQNEDTFSAARAFGVSSVEKILDKGLWDGAASKIFYNVNFPPVLAQDVTGVQYNTATGAASLTSSDVGMSSSSEARPATQEEMLQATLCLEEVGKCACG